jgi:hypothetical protein
VAKSLTPRTPADPAAPRKRSTSSTRRG